MNEDWLDIGEDEPVGGLPAVVEIPSDLVARAQLVEACWSKLSVKQKAFLDALRDNRFNVRRTVELGIAGKTAHRNWMQTGEYATVLQVWQANAALGALNAERLLIRQDAIVEMLLEPKPILHQGVPTGYYEVEAGAAGRANEALLDRAVPKDAAEKTRVVVNVVRLTGENDPDV